MLFMPHRYPLFRLPEFKVKDHEMVVQFTHGETKEVSPIEAARVRTQGDLDIEIQAANGNNNVKILDVE